MPKIQTQFPRDLNALAQGLAEPLWQFEAAAGRVNLDKWLTRPEVCHLSNTSKSGLYKAIAERRAPGPDIKLGRRFARWKTSTVAAWLADPVGWAEQNRASIEGVRP
jgi:predicted DNA-binding transcriptional regulator AlpA